MAVSREKRSKLGKGRKLHRWLGVLLFLPLIVITATGIALNHSTDLQLDEKKTRASWVLQRYGMLPKGDAISYGLLEGNLLTNWGDEAFLNHSLIPSVSGVVVGFVAIQDQLAIATAEKTFILCFEGELIETLDEASLPTGNIIGIASSPERRLTLQTDDKKIWQFDESLLEFSETTDQPFLWSISKRASETDKKAILADYSGPGVSWYRVILDLHSGNFFGPVGRYFVDLLGLGIIILALTGVRLLFKNRRRSLRDNN